jgi:hypothetical protein
VLGDVATSYGLPVWIALPACVLVLWGVLRFFGTPTGDPVALPDAPGVARA